MNQEVSDILIIFVNVELPKYKIHFNCFIQIFYIQRFGASFLYFCFTVFLVLKVYTCTL